jgi:hypothetical protein
VISEGVALPGGRGREEKEGKACCRDVRGSWFVVRGSWLVDCLMVTERGMVLLLGIIFRCDRVESQRESRRCVSRLTPQIPVHRGGGGLVPRPRLRGSQGGFEIAHSVHVALPTLTCRALLWLHRPFVVPPSSTYRLPTVPPPFSIATHSSLYRPSTVLPSPPNRPSIAPPPPSRPSTPPFYRPEPLRPRQRRPLLTPLPQVTCPAGSLIIWDSRLIHWNRTPTGSRTRVAVYACYCPASFAAPEALECKAEVYQRRYQTTHVSGDRAPGTGHRTGAGASWGSAVSGRPASAFRFVPHPIPAVAVRPLATVAWRASVVGVSFLGLGDSRMVDTRAPADNRSGPR